MYDLHGGQTGPQFFVLSEKSYDELKSIQSLLGWMAAVAYTEEDEINGNTILTMRRDQIYYFFSQLSSQIGDALDRVGKENEMGERRSMWQ